MFQIGDSLREARTRRGLSSADVHKGIRIRERYLTALEEERWDMLPGDAYTKGFLRTYAEFLGLNGQLYVDEFNARLRNHEEEAAIPDSRAPRRRPSGGVLRALVAVLVVGAAVAGLAAWRLGGSNHAAHTAAPPARAKRAHSARAKPAAAVAAGPVSAVFHAARGRCWLLVRAGGPTGAKLYEGVLEQGMTMTFPVATQLWVRMGRPYVVDIRVGRRSISPQSQNPEDLTLTRS